MSLEARTCEQHWDRRYHTASVLYSKSQSCCDTSNAAVAMPSISIMVQPRVVEAVPGRADGHHVAVVAQSACRGMILRCGSRRDIFSCHRGR